MNKIIITLIFLQSTFAIAASPNERWNKELLEHNLKPSEQAYCYADSQGAIQGQNTTLHVNPASVTKLYVSLWALSELGPGYRYSTKFCVSNDTLNVVGAQDPYFTSENAFHLISQLNEAGITHIEKIILSGPFYFNWNDDRELIKKDLYKYLNTAKWNKTVKAEYDTLENVIRDMNLPISLNPHPEFSVSQIEWSEQSLTSRSGCTYFKSSPIMNFLKQMNIYSTNFMAQKIFDRLGGTKMFSEYLLRNFNVGSETAMFYTGSGLGTNYTTCELTLKVIDRLLEVIEHNRILPSQIISVPPNDGGTLAERFTEPRYRQTLLAKTGTLDDTSALAGMLNTSHGLNLFGIFNHTTNTTAARNIQDEMVKEIFGVFGEPVRLDYETSKFIPLVDAGFTAWE